MAHLASSVSYGTIKSYLCAVRSLQIDLGYGDPLVATPRLEHVLRGIRRALSLKSPIRPPRLPVTQNLMLLIRTSLNLADFDHAMFWAAFCTTWFVFLRVSEFTAPPSGFDPAVHLSLHDVAVDSHLHPSAVFLTIKASKTDLFRKGVQLYLPRTDRLLCPVSSRSYFLHRRGNLAGPLFVFLDGTALSRRHVTDRLRTILAAAGVDGNFSSHSTAFGSALPLPRAPLRLADQNSGPLVQRRLSRVRAFLQSYSSPGSFTACLFTVVFSFVSVSRSLPVYLPLKSFSLHSCLLDFFFSFLPPVLRWGMQSVKHQLPHPLHCLEPSSLTARQLGVGFHSNRPSTDPLVGPPPSLRGQSTGALSPLHSSQTPSPHIA